MMINRRVVYWGIPLMIVLFIGAVVFGIISYFGSGEYPIGGGRHEDSPNGIYLAQALNMGYPDGEGHIWFYEFKISRKSDRSVIGEFRIQDDDQSIQFRQGSGKIFWNDDSKSVRFGDLNTTLWEYTIP